MFLDEAQIEVRGGVGGKGCIAFRREKYVPYGGPNGGDGGRGGTVYVVADENADTLSHYASRKKFEAEKGQFGMGQQCNGHSGEDLYLAVPPGTVVTEISASGKPRHLGDLIHHGDKLLVARGGKGGYGNAHFKSSTRQAPDFAELGEPGEVRTIKLDLKLVADIGIIGYPSVGKSTLISVISGARPKIAAYAFTTLIPNLGVVSVGGRSYIVCDVPGLIEGASEGKGLGHEFLRHIERCGALLHVLDVSRCLREGEEPDPQLLVDDYKAIRKELSAYSPLLAEKRELVVLNKVDLLGDDVASLEKALKKAGIKLFAKISAATRNGVDDMVKKLLKVVLEERAKRDEHSRKEMEEAKKSETIPVLQPHLQSDKMGAYHLKQFDDGSIRISGARLEQFTSMTDFENEEGVRRFQDVINRVGVAKALKKIRKNNEHVYIGNTRVDLHL